MSLKKSVCVGVIAACFAAGSAQAALIAQWTFNTGTSADLTDTSNTYTLTQGGIAGDGPVTTFNNDGTVSLNAASNLFTTQINGASIPTLRQNTTIWARVRMDPVPTTGEAWYMGLMATANGRSDSFTDIGLTARHLTSGSDLRESAFAKVSLNPSSSASNINVGGPEPANYAEFFNIAIVFNDQPDLGNAQVHIWLDGQTSTSVNSTDPTYLMNQFSTFAIGRVKNSAPGIDLVFDEVRIYDETLSDAQIAALEPVAVPEPASMGLLSVAIGVIANARRH